MIMMMMVMMMSFIECSPRASHSAKLILPTVPPALPATLQHRDISLSQMREARIHGVSQPAQGHSARKWQSCGLSCLPVLSYGESQNPCQPPRHRCTFCVLPHSGSFCTEGSLTASAAVRGMGLGGGARGRDAKGGSPNSPQKEEKKKLLEVSRFKTRPVLSHEQKLIYSNLAPDT